MVIFESIQNLGVSDSTWVNPEKLMSARGDMKGLEKVCITADDFNNRR